MILFLSLNNPSWNLAGWHKSPTHAHKCWEGIANILHLVPTHHHTPHTVFKTGNIPFSMFFQFSYWSSVFGVKFRVRYVVEKNLKVWSPISYFCTTGIGLGLGLGHPSLLWKKQQRVSGNIEQWHYSMKNEDGSKIRSGKVNFHLFAFGRSCLSVSADHPSTPQNATSKLCMGCSICSFDLARFSVCIPRLQNRKSDNP